MRITETTGAPPPMTRDELVAARDRYEARIPAQDLRLAQADRTVAKAKESMDAAKAERSAALDAQTRLAAYIADLTAQIGV